MFYLRLSLLSFFVHQVQQVHSEVQVMLACEKF